MQNKPMPPEGKNSDKLEAKSALCDAACCASSISGVRIDVNSVGLFREYLLHEEREKVIRSVRNTPRNPIGEKSQCKECPEEYSVDCVPTARSLWLSYLHEIRSARSIRSSSDVRKGVQERRGIPLMSGLRVAWIKFCGLIRGLFLHNV
jgi:hypothetical protein